MHDCWVKRGRCKAEKTPRRWKWKAGTRGSVRRTGKRLAALHVARACEWHCSRASKQNEKLFLACLRLPLTFWKRSVLFSPRHSSLSFYPLESSHFLSSFPSNFFPFSLFKRTVRAYARFYYFELDSVKWNADRLPSFLPFFLRLPPDGARDTGFARSNKHSATPRAKTVTIRSCEMPTLFAFAPPLSVILITYIAANTRTSQWIFLYRFTPIKDKYRCNKVTTFRSNHDGNDNRWSDRIQARYLQDTLLYASRVSDRSRRFFPFQSIARRRLLFVVR